MTSITAEKEQQLRDLLREACETVKMATEKDGEQDYPQANELYISALSLFDKYLEEEPSANCQRMVVEKTEEYRQRQQHVSEYLNMINAPVSDNSQ